MKRATVLGALGGCLLLLMGCSPHSQTSSSYLDPEATTGWNDKAVVSFQDYAVVAANPYAADAGAVILEQGGTAIDAAVAVQAMLTLVEPQSSGIGGGAFILYWDAQEEKLYTLDAREVAPAQADETLFYENGQVMAWRDAVVGGRSVGVPGVLQGLEQAHQRFGRLPWARLFTETIQQAQEGFVVSPRLATLLEKQINPGLQQLEPARSYFYPQGQGLQQGERVANPALADTFTHIAEEGSEYFYQGKLATRIEQAVQGSQIAPGRLTTADLSQYQAKWREPVCGAYHAYQVCSMGPPSSGGITLIQMLGMLEHFPMGTEPNEAGYHYFSQATQLAFADRNTYLADPDFVAVPTKQLVHADYLQHRATQITATNLEKAEPGLLGRLDHYTSASLEKPSTTHISIRDRYGNIVSMTSSIEQGFGSAVMVDGFLLNNQLTDFSLSPVNPKQQKVANRVEPFKRPLSSMTPVIVFNQEGEPIIALGSPGGPRIIPYVGLTLIGLLDWSLDIQEAINLPKLTQLYGQQTAVEKQQFSFDWAQALEKRGHTVEFIELNSGLHGLHRVSTIIWQGGADPRREGKVSGQ